jgi:hypothetical protein
MRLQLAGAAGGAVFALLALAAFVLNPGPSSGDGATVVEHYSAYGTRTLWATALVGIAAIGFLWFAETLASATGVGPVGVAGAAAMAALYLVAIGVWSILAEIYGGVDPATVTSEGLSDAHVLDLVGVGAAHMGNFAAAAFAGAATGALFASNVLPRWFAWAGVAVVVFRLVSALVEVASTTGWSDAVAVAGFLVFLAWVFVASVLLTAALARRPAPLPAAAL